MKQRTCVKDYAMLLLCIATISSFCLSKQGGYRTILLLADQLPLTNYQLLEKQITEMINHNYLVHVHANTITRSTDPANHALSPTLLPHLFTDMSFLAPHSYDAIYIMSQAAEKQLLRLQNGFNLSSKAIKPYEQESQFCLLCHLDICSTALCALIAENEIEQNIIEASETLEAFHDTELEGLLESQTPNIPGIPFDGRAFGCNQETIVIIDSYTTEFNTHIAILEDSESRKKFLVKQRTQQKPFWRLSTPCDKLGAIVAQTAYIPVNRVELIPAGYDFPGKRITGLPATLHNYVPGLMVDKMDPSYHVFKGTIRQNIKSAKSPKTRGLTLKVITSMAIHQDLCKIVALDTFIGNPDRHRANFFYDKIGNHYCAIDLEYSFCLNLGSFACKTIQSIIDNPNTILTPKVIQGLKTYSTVLKQLLASFTAKTLFDSLAQYAKESNAYENTSGSLFEEEIQPHRVAIAENYAACERLVTLLDKLVIQHKKRKA